MTKEKGSLILFTIIIIGVLIRFYHLTLPLIDHHRWDQTSAAMMARNILRTGFKDITKMEVDYLHDYRYTEHSYQNLEFPVYHTLVAFMWKLFGSYDYIGRLVTISFYVISSILLYYLVLLHSNDQIASIFSVIALALSPLSIYFSRTFQPEYSTIMFSVAGIYYFSLWAQRDRLLYLSLGVFSITLTILTKPFALVLGLPLLFILCNKEGRSAFLNYKNYLIALSILIPVVIWLRYSQEINMEAGSQVAWFEDDKLSKNLFSLDSRYYSTLLSRIAKNHLTIPWTILFFIGIFFIKREERHRYMFHAWAAAVFIYFIMVDNGNRVHDYYQLPFIPVAAVFIGIGSSRLWKMRWGRHITIALFIYMAGLSCIYSYRLFNNIMEWPEFFAGKALNRLTEPSDLIITAYPDGQPEMLYYADRRGWHVDLNITAENIERLKGLGAGYMAFKLSQLNAAQGIAAYLEERYKKVDSSIEKDYVIYRLGS